MADLDRCCLAVPDGWMLSHQGSGALPLAERVAAEVDAALPSDQAADADLVEAARRGQSAAFDVLVQRHQRAVYRVCYRFVGGHEDASDLTQDVFLRAYRALGSYRAQASFKTWLYRIAINAGLSRAATRQPPMDELAPEHATGDLSGDLHDELDRRRRAARVRDAVARLPPRQRAAVILRVFEDLSHEEAARALGCTVGTVKANMFHAVRKLRTLLRGV